MGGGALRVWQTINILNQQADVAVFTLFGETFTAPTHLDRVTWHHCHLHQVKRTLQDKLRRRVASWQPTGHPRLDWLYTDAGAAQLRAILNTFQPTVIIIAEIWLYRYLPLLASQGCPIILDNHNIEGDENRYYTKNGELALAPQTLKKIRQIESNFVKRTQQTWLCSQIDCDQFLRLYADNQQYSQRLRVISNGLDANYYHSPTFDTVELGKYSLLFLGRFSYAPNAEAAEILIHQIYPLLKAVNPQCQLWLVGCDPTETMLQTTQTEGIHVTGRVEDVRPYLQRASVMVVPLYRGSGTRLKILEGFAAKCPIVSTAKGAEGLAVTDGEHLLVRESPADMAAVVQTLWQQPHMTQQLVNMAHQLFVEQYSWSAVETQLEQSLAALP